MIPPHDQPQYAANANILIFNTADTAHNHKLQLQFPYTFDIIQNDSLSDFSGRLAAYAQHMDIQSKIIQHTTYNIPRKEGF